MGGQLLTAAGVYCSLVELGCCVRTFYPPVTMSEKVIPFHKVCNLAVSRDVRKYECRHRESIYVDPDERVLQCAECKAIIDPFDLVMDWMKKEVRIARAGVRLQGEVRQLEKEKVALEREVKNLKSQRKYHSAKMSQNTTVHEENHE